MNKPIKPKILQWMSFHHNQFVATFRSNVFGLTGIAGSVEKQDGGPVNLQKPWLWSINDLFETPGIKSNGHVSTEEIGKQRVRKAIQSYIEYTNKPEKPTKSVWSATSEANHLLSKTRSIVSSDSVVEAAMRAIKDNVSVDRSGLQEEQHKLRSMFDRSCYGFHTIQAGSPLPDDGETMTPTSWTVLNDEVDVLQDYLGVPEDIDLDGVCICDTTACSCDDTEATDDDQDGQPGFGESADDLDLELMRAQIRLTNAQAALVEQQVNELLDKLAPLGGRVHNPVAEIEAFRRAVQNGYPRRKAAAAFGRDVEEVDEENARDQNRLDTFLSTVGKKLSDGLRQS